MGIGKGDEDNTFSTTVTQITITEEIEEEDAVRKWIRTSESEG